MKDEILREWKREKGEGGEVEERERRTRKGETISGREKESGWKKCGMREGKGREGEEWNRMKKKGMK